MAQSPAPALDGIELEFEGAKFGDKRLATRVESLAGAMAKESSASFPQALSAAELEAAYRFFGNVKVTPVVVLQPHIRQTLGRIGSQAELLVAHDSSTIAANSPPAAL